MIQIASTTWRHLYENMPEEDVYITLGDGKFYRLDYCSVSHIDQHGRLLGDGDTIYWAIEGGEYNDSPIENKVTWLAYPVAQEEPAQEQPPQEQKTMVSNNRRTLASVLKELETLKDLASSIENDLDEIASQNEEVTLLNQEIRKLTEENALIRRENARLKSLLWGKNEVSA